MLEGFEMAAGRIGERIKTVRVSQSLDAEAFGKPLGVSDKTQFRYERGDSFPDAKYLAALCMEYGVPPAWLLLGALAPEGEANFVYVPVLDLRPVPGRPRDVESSTIGVIGLPTATVEAALGSEPRKLSYVRVVGDAMEPTVKAGDLILIDRNQLQISDGLHLLRIDDAVAVRRIEKRPGGQVLVRSDSPLYSEYVINLEKPPEGFGIVGRVVSLLKWIA